MAFFVSVTRLRIRGIRFLPAFFIQTLRTQQQLRRAEGFREGSLLPDRKRTFWTLTLWESEDHMRAYMLAGAHRQVMPRLIAWCDEASVVHWEQPDPVLPGWGEAASRMQREGRPSKLRHPSEDHLAMSFRLPERTVGSAIAPAR